MANRRVGYDISFHCPKSVSILYGLSSDDKVLNAFEESVDKTMREIEVDMQTRIRTNNQYDDRSTGNLLWAGFTHLTARPVDNNLDPHLHKHCFVLMQHTTRLKDVSKQVSFIISNETCPIIRLDFKKTGRSPVGFGLWHSKNKRCF